VQLLTYFRDQRVRRNQSIIEIAGIDPASGSLRTNRIYERNPLTDEFEKVGESMILHEIAKEREWSAMQLERELRNRWRVLEYLAENNIRHISEVATIIQRFYFNPDGVLKQISADFSIIIIISIFV
jgi:flagellar protein FlaI